MVELPCVVVVVVVDIEAMFRNEAREQRGVQKTLVWALLVRLTIIAVAAVG